MELDELLMDEIQSQMAELKSIPIGSEESNRIIDNITKLNKQLNDNRKLDLEKVLKEKQHQLDAEKQKHEQELKDKQHQLEVEKQKYDQVLKKKQQIIDASHKKNQIEDEKKNNNIKNAIAITSVAASSALAVWGTKTVLKFEEFGSVTTFIGKTLIQKLIPKK